MPLHRHKKFERSKEPPDRLRIQPRDYELLRDVADYRFLSTDQILALHKGGDRNLRRRLSALYHLGYLERPASQKSLPSSGSFLIYSIGDKGAELLSRRELVGRKTAQATFPHLTHAMMISQFHAVLAVALKENPERPQIAKWVQGYELKNLLSVNRGTPELVPDAFFSLESKKGVWNFFLEADRSTMTRERVLDKMKIYWKWRHDRKILEALGISRYFRVLTITPSEERRDNLRKITKKVSEEKNTHRFLFLSEKEYSLKNPEALLNPAWLSPENDAKHTILE